MRLCCCLNYETTSMPKSTRFTSHAFLVLLLKISLLLLLSSFQAPYGLSAGRVRASSQCQLAFDSDFSSVLRNLKLLVYLRWVSLAPGSEQYKMASPPERAKRVAWCKWCPHGGINKGRATRLLIGHTPEHWLPTAFATSAIFKGQSQKNFVVWTGMFHTQWTYCPVE